MPEQRTVYRVGTSHVVALPRRVRAHLAVKRGDAVYWHVVRGKEAVLTTVALRSGGRPEGLKLARAYDVALQEIDRVRQQRAARDRGQYNEGFSVGYQLATERLTNPGGASAERQRRRQAAARAWPPTPTHQRAERRRRARASPPPAPPPVPTSEE